MRAVTKRKKIHVGIIRPTGADLAIDAVLMAFDEINRHGGVLGRTVETLIIADVDDMAVCNDAVAELADAGAQSVFAGYGPVMRKALAHTLAGKNALLWHAAPCEGLEEPGNVVFGGVCPNQMVMPALEWAMRHMGPRAILLYADSVFARTTAAIARADLAGSRGGARLVAECVIAGAESTPLTTLAGIGRCDADFALVITDDAITGATPATSITLPASLCNIPVIFAGPHHGQWMPASPDSTAGRFLSPPAQKPLITTLPFS